MTATFGVAAQKKFVPHTLMVGVEVPSIARSFLFSKRNVGELQAAINVLSHHLAFEYGFEDINRRDSLYTFKTNGSYWRGGIDLALNPKNPRGDVIFFGLRHGRATFKNSLDARFQSEPYGNPQLSWSNKNMRGRWWEITFGLKVNVAKNLMLGYTTRFKLTPTITGGDTLAPYDLPGYGRARKSTNFGFSFYAYYKLRFRKEREKPDDGNTL